ncbi:uncharacterized protein K452DRAFT_254599 [Aplosporella prunicola CBS 121167]|uniref:Protein HRI1 n=1 Tax=Aplosporella prunicola CBS 121167 TaxID=1176127 RepID=A0A6A6B7E4_9PEZI|nr:uncharacterized protein K452DRAFT_254599 [Aplosporella prunicola CBS 121167]KAF2139313.1 hypothetical protein K452DRAFT_254599 [Aplosporella prunicola CBS 121167]
MTDTEPMPDVSQRQHMRWTGEEAFEPTNTLVLTTPSQAFVDIRIFNPNVVPTKGAYEPEPYLPNTGGPMSRLQWAFSGIAQTGKTNNATGGTYKKWMHIIDSTCHWGEKPPIDEGYMFPTEDPDVTLEKGKMKHPDTGVHTEYEELWKSITPLPAGKDSGKLGLRHCIVATLDAPEKKARGIVIRVGHLCQGLMMVDDRIDVERWVYDSRAEHEVNPPTVPEDVHPIEGWTRIAKLGSGFLPCSWTFDAQQLLEADTLAHGEMIWQIKETYSW